MELQWGQGSVGSACCEISMRAEAKACGVAEELSCFEEVMVVRVVRSGGWAEADVGCLVVEVVVAECL